MILLFLEFQVLDNASTEVRLILLFARVVLITSFELVLLVEIAGLSNTNCSGIGWKHNRTL